VEAAPPVRGPETLTFQGQPYGRVQTEQQRDVGSAKRALTDFAKYAKYDDGNLVIRRNKKTGQLDLFDSLTRQWVKTDEARLQQFASAQAAVRKYE
jgi:hypothetical protein